MESASERGLSAAVLKNIAVITMTIDHVTAFLLKDYLKAQGVFNFYSSEWYTLGRIIGRIAFVLYAFMIAQGAVHTKNKGKYALRLFMLAVISIVPHSYVNARTWFNPEDMNIFFLLFLGLLTIYAYDWLNQKISRKPPAVLLQLVMIAVSCTIAILCNFEYGMMGILLLLLTKNYDFLKYKFKDYLIIATKGKFLLILRALFLEAQMPRKDLKNLSICPMIDQRKI